MPFQKSYKIHIKIQQHRWSTIPHDMTVKLVPFFQPGTITLPGRKKRGIVGTIGPCSIPLANRPSPRPPMGLGPKASRPRTVNRPRSARATLHLPAWAPLTPDVSFPDAPWCSDTYHPRRLLSRCALVPGCLFTRMLPFPINDSTKRNYQPAHHDISICSPKNQSPCLQRNRKALPTAARSGKQLHKKKNKSSFPK